MSDTQIFEPDTSNSRSFGKYKVIKELGRGAMGVVYQCFDPDFERTVAIKILSPELLSLDTSGEYRQRFKNEMKAAGRLAHPNVISVYDAGEQDGVPYFVMEYVDGIELKQSLDEGERYELQRALKLMRDMLNGLQYIHQHGITHRDLKPANIFITRRGSAKITDFGIAKLESSELTRVGTIIGSPRYMSPEQCQGLPVDARSDLFAAGIIFYQLLTNEHCFDANSPTAIMQKIIHGKPEAPSVLIPTLPKHFDKVIFKALEKSPEDRFQNAEEFIEAMDTAAAGKSPAGTTTTSKLPKVMGAVAGVLMGAVAAVYFLPSVLEQPVKPEQQTTAGQSHTADDPTDETGSDNIERVVDTPANLSQSVGNTSENQVVSNNQQNLSQDSDDGLEPELSAKIDKLLKVARVHQMQGRLVTPSGSSAYDAYRIVLDIDPDNRLALDGMEALELSLVDRIQELNEKGNSELAKSQAVAGAKLFPENQALVQLAASQP